MENQAEQTKKAGVILSHAEAEEFWEFKRQKRVAEVAASLTKSEIVLSGRDESKRFCDTAKRLSCAAVRVLPTSLAAAKNALAGSNVFIDCVVGGTGETLPKVKAYEAKLAIRGGAKEITLVLCPSAWKAGRTGETKRELKRVCRAAKKATVKVAADSALSLSELVRLGKLAAECGAKYISVPFFSGCENLKQALHDSCMLEVTGVETSSDYKALIAVGAERICTSHAEEIHAELMKEAENFSLAVDLSSSADLSSSTSSVPSKESGTPSEIKTQPIEKPIAKAEQMSVLGDKKLLNGVLK